MSILKLNVRRVPDMTSIFGIWGLLLRFRLFFELLYTTYVHYNLAKKLFFPVKEWVVLELGPGV